MQDQTLNEYKKTRSKIYSLALTMLIFMAIMIGTTKVLLVYHEHRGYIFKENVGFLSEYAYNRSASNPNNDIIFYNEILVQSDYILINDVSYQAIFSTNDIFEVGYPSDWFQLSLVSFYEFEFIYGGTFMNDNEIVISESISIKLFNNSNSVHETIIINDMEFVISGVIKEQTELMNAIYFSENNIEIILDDLIRYDFRIFQDQDLAMKLYERGGINLVLRTTTYNNQDSINDVANLIIQLLLIVVGIILLFFQPKTFKKYKVKFEDINVVRFILNRYATLTMTLIYSLIYLIISLYRIVPMKVSYVFWINLIIRFYWIIAILYSIPILIYIIKKFLHRNKSDNVR
ncbi:MAG: ABC transporter permease [Acholeplasmataceae bacterium]|nr:ABC transporter permease [Acholeplasmataceae bacterium]